MRYTTQLHSHHAIQRRHALQYNWLSSVIGLVAFGLAAIVILLVVNMSQLNSADLFGGFLASLIRISLAYTIAVLLAIGLALMITANRLVEAILLPIFDVLQSFPSFALFPVFVIVFANQPEITIILVLVITIVWPIMFTIISSIKTRREDLEEAATVFGAVGPRRLSAFTMPTLLPSIITGSIIGWGEGWEFIIGAELLVNTNIGIGHYLGVLGDGHQNALLGLGILILMLLLFVINQVVWLPLLHQATKYSSET